MRYLAHHTLAHTMGTQTLLVIGAVVCVILAVAAWRYMHES